MSICFVDKIVYENSNSYSTFQFSSKMKIVLNCFKVPLIAIQFRSRSEAGGKSVDRLEEVAAVLGKAVEKIVPNSNHWLDHKQLIKTIYYEYDVWILPRSICILP